MPDKLRFLHCSIRPMVSLSFDCPKSKFIFVFVKFLSWIDHASTFFFSQYTKSYTFLQYLFPYTHKTNWQCHDSKFHRRGLASRQYGSSYWAGYATLLLWTLIPQTCMHKSIFTISLHTIRRCNGQSLHDKIILLFLTIWFELKSSIASKFFVIIEYPLKDIFEEPTVSANVRNNPAQEEITVLYSV